MTIEIAQNPIFAWMPLRKSSPLLPYDKNILLARFVEVCGLCSFFFVLVSIFSLALTSFHGWCWFVSGVFHSVVFLVLMNYKNSPFVHFRFYVIAHDCKSCHSERRGWNDDLWLEKSSAHVWKYLRPPPPIYLRVRQVVNPPHIHSNQVGRLLNFPINCGIYTALCNPSHCRLYRPFNQKCRHLAGLVNCSRGRSIRLPWQSTEAPNHLNLLM